MYIRCIKIKSGIKIKAEENDRVSFNFLSSCFTLIFLEVLLGCSVP